MAYDKPRRGRTFSPEDYTINGVDLSPHMMDLSGADYLKVAGRVLLFRAMHPKGSIQVDLVDVNHERGFAMFKALIMDGDGNTLAIDYGSETLKGFPHGHIEKASTVAVGRALAAAGFGTQFAVSDFYDAPDAKLADAPVGNHLAGEGDLGDKEAPGRDRKGNATVGTTEDDEPLATEVQIKQSSRELARVGWDGKKGQDYLEKRFGKKARVELTIDEMEAFIDHLRSLPTARAQAEV